MTERLIRISPKEAKKLGLDPNVSEAAAFAHDLGHPPFGHIAEEELDRLVRAAEVPDGFEGNAQSFRIVTKLAVRRDGVDGLDLTRATLAAILKYPWLRETDGKKSRKFGAYATERDDFVFARLLYSDSERQSPAARIMDLADDIAYSVSDLEDFVRAGRIPFNLLASKESSEERDIFLKSAFERINKNNFSPGEMEKAFIKLLAMMPLGRQYAGTKSDRARIRKITGTLMGQYIDEAKLNVAPQGKEHYVVISRQSELEIALLKHLTWHYVIDNPALALQQKSQKEIIRGLFCIFKEAAESKDEGATRFFPRKLAEQLGSEEAKLIGANSHIRYIADFIAGMSENEAVEMFHRLRGISNGRTVSMLRV